VFTRYFIPVEYSFFGSPIIYHRINYILVIRIGIVDDNKDFRLSFSQFIKFHADLDLIISSDGGLNMIKEFQKAKTLPKLIFIDLHMPKMDGISLANYIFNHFPEIKCIGLSSYADSFHAYQFILAGGSGYVSKANFPAQFLELVKNVNDNLIYIDKKIIVKPNILNKKSNETRQQVSNLNSKEIQFLELCAGSDFSYSEIADLMHVAEDSLKNYKKSLKEKFDLTGRSSYVRFALQYGIIMVAQYTDLISDMIRDF
jgi:DNA-binding NarL/FixJ family response regulator